MPTYKQIDCPELRTRLVRRGERCPTCQESGGHTSITVRHYDRPKPAAKPRLHFSKLQLWMLKRVLERAKEDFEQEWWLNKDEFLDMVNVLERVNNNLKRAGEM